MGSERSRARFPFRILSEPFQVSIPVNAGMDTNQNKICKEEILYLLLLNKGTVKMTQKGGFVINFNKLFKQIFTP